VLDRLEKAFDEVKARLLRQVGSWLPGPLAGWLAGCRLAGGLAGGAGNLLRSCCLRPTCCLLHSQPPALEIRLVCCLL
jgi:hypothetical protein